MTTYYFGDSMLTMPLLIYMPYFNGGGAEVALITLANYWSDNGCDVRFLVNSEEGPTRSRLSSKVPVVNLGSRHTRKILVPLISYFRKERPEIVASALISANIATSIAVKLANAQTAHVALVRNYLSHEIYEEKGWRRFAMGRALRWALRSADHIACVSSDVKTDAVRFASLRPERVSVTYNAVKSIRAADSVASKFLSGQKVVLCIGRLSEQKDFATAIRAVALLRHRYEVECELRFIGEGTLESQLRSLSAALGLSCVKFLGYRSDIPAQLEGADVLLVTSRYEGFPNVIAEALAYGTTVVATDAPGGAREILEDGRYGYLAEVGNVEAIAASLYRAFATPIPPGAAAERASAFDLATVARRYEAAIQSAADTKLGKNRE